MVKVEIPRASWENLLYVLELAESHRIFCGGIYKEIADQVYSQEY